jgi:hypothetical protein
MVAPVDSLLNMPDLVNYHRLEKSLTETMRKRPQIKNMRTSLETDNTPSNERGEVWTTANF